MGSIVDRYDVTSLLPPCCPDMGSRGRENGDNRHWGNEREQIILEYVPMIKYVARRVAVQLPPNVALDDLISAGVIGLMDAIEKFDHTRGTTFKTYAEFRVRGAMLDELRSLDWVPRSMRGKESAIECAYADLECTLGRSAQDEEVAAYLGLALDEFYEWLRQICGVLWLSLDAPLVRATPGEKLSLLDLVATDETQDPANVAQARRFKELFADAIDDLPFQEKTVIYLYYYEEFSMEEIGRVLSVSESRISQVHSRAIYHLRGTAPFLLKDDIAEHTNNKNEKEQIMSESNGNGLAIHPGSISYRSSARRAQTLLPELRFAIQTREIKPTTNGVTRKFHVSPQTAMIALRYLEDEGILSKKPGKTRSRALLVPITPGPSSAPDVDGGAASLTQRVFQEHVPSRVQSEVISSPLFTFGLLTTPYAEGPLPLSLVESSLREFAELFEVNVPMRRLLTSAAQYMTELERIREIMSKIST